MKKKRKLQAIAWSLIVTMLAGIMPMPVAAAAPQIQTNVKIIKKTAGDTHFDYFYVDLKDRSGNPIKDEAGKDIRLDVYCMDHERSWPHPELHPDYVYDTPLEYSDTLIEQLRRVLYVGYPNNGKKLYRIIGVDDAPKLTLDEFNAMLVLTPEVLEIAKKSGQFPGVEDMEFTYREDGSGTLNDSEKNNLQILMDLFTYIVSMSFSDNEENQEIGRIFRASSCYKPMYLLFLLWDDADPSIRDTEYVLDKFNGMYLEGYDVTEEQAHDATQEAVWAVLSKAEIPDNKAGFMPEEGSLGELLYDFAKSEVPIPDAEVTADYIRSSGIELYDATDTNLDNWKLIDPYNSSDSGTVNIQYTYHFEDKLWHSQDLIIKAPEKTAGKPLYETEYVFRYADNSIAGQTHNNEIFHLTSSKKPTTGDKISIHSEVTWPSWLFQFKEKTGSKYLGKNYQDMAGLYLHKVDLDLNVKYTAEDLGEVSVTKKLADESSDLYKDEYFWMTATINTGENYTKVIDLPITIKASGSDAVSTGVIKLLPGTAKTTERFGLKPGDIYTIKDLPLHSEVMFKEVSLHKGTAEDPDTENPLGNWTPTYKNLSVSSTDPANVKVSPKVSESDAGAKVTVVNDYTVASVEVPISGTKILKHATSSDASHVKDIKEDQFEFVLYPDDAKYPMPEGSNPTGEFAKPAKIVRNGEQTGAFADRKEAKMDFGSIMFRKPGKYTYMIEERQISSPNISRDMNHWHLTVNVFVDSEGHTVAHTEMDHHDYLHNRLDATSLEPRDFVSGESGLSLLAGSAAFADGPVPVYSQDGYEAGGPAEYDVSDYGDVDSDVIYEDVTYLEHCYIPSDDEPGYIPDGMFIPQAALLLGDNLSIAEENAGISLTAAPVGLNVTFTNTFSDEEVKKQIIVRKVFEDTSVEVPLSDYRFHVEPAVEDWSAYPVFEIPEKTRACDITTGEDGWAFSAPLTFKVSSICTDANWNEETEQWIKDFPYVITELAEPEDIEKHPGVTFNNNKFYATIRVTCERIPDDGHATTALLSLDPEYMEFGTSLSKVMKAESATEQAEVKEVGEESKVTVTTEAEEKTEVTATPEAEEKTEVTATPEVEEESEVTGTPEAEEKSEVTGTPEAEEESEVITEPEVEGEPEVEVALSHSPKQSFLLTAKAWFMNLLAEVEDIIDIPMGKSGKSGGSKASTSTASIAAEVYYSYTSGSVASDSTASPSAPIKVNNQYKASGSLEISLNKLVKFFADDKREHHAKAGDAYVFFLNDDYARNDKTGYSFTETFEVDETGKKLVCLKSDGTQYNPDKPIIIEFKKTGEYRFTLTERDDHATGSDMTYSKEEWVIDVSVKDNGTGYYEITPTCTRIDGATIEVASISNVKAASVSNAIAVRFTNTFKPKVIADSMKIRKKLEGRNWKSGEVFEIMIAHGEATASDTDFDPCDPHNIEWHHIDVTHPTRLTLRDTNLVGGSKDTAESVLDHITFHKPGTYYFRIEEAKPIHKDRMVYDGTQYIIKMVVDRAAAPDNGLVISSTSMWKSTKVEGAKWPTDFAAYTGDIEFVNKDTGELEVIKSLEGGTDRTQEFGFSLKLENGSAKGADTFADASHLTVEKKRDNGDGTMTVVDPAFKLTFNADGVANFKLRRGEQFLLTGILGGTKYTLTETDAKDRIVTSKVVVDGTVASSGAETAVGTIVGSREDEILYTNTDKQDKPDTPSGGGGGGGGGGGSTPKTPEPQKPTDPKGPMKTIQELGGIGGGGNPLSRWLSVLGANEEDPFNLMVLAMTGDQGKAGLLALICLAALGGLGILFFGKKRKKKN